MKKTIRFLFYLLTLGLVLWTMWYIFHLSSFDATGSSAMSSRLCTRLVHMADRLFRLNLSEAETVRLIRVLEFPIRKCAHFLEYAGLSFFLQLHLLSLTCFHIRVRPGFKNRLCWLGIACAGFYAVTDEIHQIFVPGRACRLFDVGVDTLGAVTGMTLYFLMYFLLQYFFRHIDEM